MLPISHRLESLIIKQYYQQCLNSRILSPWPMHRLKKTVSIVRVCWRFARVGLGYPDQTVLMSEHRWPLTKIICSRWRRSWFRSSLTNKPSNRRSKSMKLSYSAFHTSQARKKFLRSSSQVHVLAPSRPSPATTSPISTCSRAQSTHSASQHEPHKTGGRRAHPMQIRRATSTTALRNEQRSSRCRTHRIRRQIRATIAPVLTVRCSLAVWNNTVTAWNLLRRHHRGWWRLPRASSLVLTTEMRPFSDAEPHAFNWRRRTQN